MKEVWKDTGLKLLKVIEDGELIIEEFRDVADYEGFYQVSSFGRVLSLERNILNHHKRGRPIKEKILKQYSTDRGYLTISLSKNGVNNFFRVHRLVVTEFIGEIKEGFEVNHLDGDKSNNFSSNLEIATHSGNCKHRYSVLGQNPMNKGKFGKDHPLSKAVKCIDTGEIFESLTLAERKYNLSSGEISKSITGYRGRKTSAGLNWRYE